MAAVPFAKRYWTEIAALGRDLEAAYWNRAQHHHVSGEERVEAIDLLVKHDRPWEAVALLSDIVHGNAEPGVDLFKLVLNALRALLTPVG